MSAHVTLSANCLSAKKARIPNLVPRAFPLKNGLGGKKAPPFFKGKALGTRLEDPVS